ncbi:MAG: hypothetical protein ABEK50_16240 [bacterium]
MKLHQVWDSLTDSVKIAIRSVTFQNSRIRTRALLGALSDLPDAPSAEILSRVERESGVELIHPDDLARDPEPCPGDVTFSPCVKETLNFYRIHHMRDVTPANVALRLLQIGSGSTVRELESAGYLSSLQQSLEELVD